LSTNLSIAEDVTFDYTTDAQGVIDRRNALQVNQTYINLLLHQAKEELIENHIKLRTKNVDLKSK
jgi:hypothetical protein